MGNGNKFKRKRSSSTSESSHACSSPPQKKEIMLVSPPDDDQDSYFGLLFDTVDISIDDDKHITVHKGLLCRASEWFSHQIDENNTLQLSPDFDAQILKTFLVWLYSGHLMPPATHPEDDRPEESRKVWTGMHLANLFVFAFTFDIRTLKNDVMTALVQKYTGQENSEFVDLPTLRKVMNKYGNDNAFIQFHAYHRAARGLKNVGQLPEDLDQWPAGFLAMVIREGVRIKEQKDSGNGMKVQFSAQLACRWHEHAGEKEREVCLERLMGCCGGH